MHTFFILAESEFLLGYFKARLLRSGQGWGNIRVCLKKKFWDTPTICIRLLFVLWSSDDETIWTISLNIIYKPQFFQIFKYIFIWLVNVKHHC